ncbi:triphosphoribosyl-dephospho-CoA synthase CitG (plasmid) [Weissella cibaria]|jgi:holo-ACP synthase/triphosphoribosyl-dephospho-CoA synthase|uniref:triphosphoribosyl-dephospho-CoA synthase CitG n=1 Tax=Weissella cibaria TaxID=137591 RepID=UPI0011934940|nr:triphosphoribosyl-dephospho-CoA synthase CitG [Weissella cibaria]TVV33067.1 triphosphoribosyl-dephospho-CoA synthase CitG [Weissella cibaria]
MSIFDIGEAVDLLTVLDNREWRSRLQDKLKVTNYDKIVISAKLNIPGPIKNNDILQKIFMDGWQTFVAGLECNSQYEMLFAERVTGPEAFITVDGNLAAVKKTAILFEETYVLGRLFDIDVMANGQADYQLSREELGFGPRLCLICGKPAKVCAKEQNHTLDEGYEVINQMYQGATSKELIFEKESQETVVNNALKGLLYEVSLNPKPGLVDPVSMGSHTDMNMFMFIDSSLSLKSYLDKAFKLGRNFEGSDLKLLFNALRAEGVLAEQTMFNATNNVNTHKGAIFSLGIWVTAIAYSTKDGSATMTEVRRVIQRMVEGLIEKDLASNRVAMTAGEQQFQTYQLTGIRGEAVNGFPGVAEIAVPFLQATFGTMTQRLLDTLMKIAATLEDSTLIKRAKTPDVLAEIKEWTSIYFKLGGSHTEEGMKYLYDLDRVFIERNLSIGGSADTLILTIFIGQLTGLL